MAKRNLQVLVGVIVVLSMALSCAPAAPAPAAQKATSAPAAAATAAAPAASGATAAPATTPKPAAAAAEEGKPVYGGTMAISSHDDPPSFDVHQEASFAVFSAIGSPSYNSLTTWDNVDHNKMVPDLAKKWEVSSDGLTYTFYLEEGVKWQDGALFSADDVKFSLLRQKDPPKGVYSVSQTQYESVKSIDVVDPNTVKVTMSRPYAAFLMLMSLTNNVIMPKHILEKQLDMKKEVVGTGPWKLNKYTRGVSVELVKSPNYFKKGLPYMDKMLQYVIADNTTRLAAFRTGQVLTDIQDHEPPMIDAIEQQMKDVAIAYRIPGVLNTKNPFITQNKPPFNDVRVRQAVNLALDRWEFVKLLQPGRYAIGGYMVPGGLWTLPDDQLLAQPGYAKSGPDKDAEREKAKKLLADAGYPNGLDVEIRARNLNEYTEQAVWLKSQLEKIGIRSTIRPIETTAYFDDLKNQTYQIMASGYGYTVDDPELIFNEAYMKEGGKNWGKYYNPDFEKMFQEMSLTVDPAKRKEIVLKMELLLHETIPFPVLGWKTRTVGVWKKVKGYIPWTSDGRLSSSYRHEYTWLDPNLPPK